MAGHASPDREVLEEAFAQGRDHPLERSSQKPTTLRRSNTIKPNTMVLMGDQPGRRSQVAESQDLS